ncbi:MAG TPA: YdiU family protein [Rhodocyclaceae bacterium]|nr:YdiU family protein [Rhodocyclaceae bacterium]
MNAPLSRNEQRLADLPLESRYANLGQPFHTPVKATQLPEPQLLQFNHALADELGFATAHIEHPELTEILAGNQPWPGYASMASVYAGHQFGVFVPQLGDGRALMIAELRDRKGQRQELQLKGAGRTPYSRGADGRAVLRSSIREYLCSEAMHALGVPTTRCLSLVGSNEPVQRETVETAAVVCRVAPSFVRFGHFEFFSRHGYHEHLAQLADHVIDEHFPHLRNLPDRYPRWLTEVVERTARLMAHWQAIGFCHGVMNTDNFSILGLTIDYGPYGFIDAFQWDHICNHSDEGGRYAYFRQPPIGQWNCARLLEAALPLLAASQEEAVPIAEDIYAKYAPAHREAAARHWADKLGLREVREGDAELIQELLGVMHRSSADFTNTFRNLAKVHAGDDGPAVGVREDVLELEAFDAWVSNYRVRLRSEGNVDDADRAARMNAVNPRYVLRNHLAQAAIEKAQVGDMSEMARLTQVLSRPFEEQAGMEAYAVPPEEEQRHICVSCSS